jgi:hypothetical protein
MFISAAGNFQRRRALNCLMYVLFLEGDLGMRASFDSLTVELLLSFKLWLQEIAKGWLIRLCKDSGNTGNFFCVLRDSSSQNFA